MSEKVQTPQNQGAVAGKRPPYEVSPDPIPTSDFDDAHGHSRSGDGKSATTPGRLGNSGERAAASPLSYEPPQVMSPGCVTDTDGAFAWPDAYGGGLGNS